MNPLDSVEFRLQELAAGFSLGDVSEAELLEMKSYDQEIFQNVVSRSDETAARTYLTFQATVPAEAMPAELSARLRKMALGFFDEAPIPNVRIGSNVAPSSIGLREIAAWLCTAASIALVLSLWLPGKTRLSASLQQQRDSLIASASDLVRTEWESTKPETKQALNLGEVVWSSATQQGFMTIRGLPINDVTKEQYQLWIIDPTRDANPIDGGVFDIANESESIVPIQAKLRVDKPTVFAITVEKPGGVVVSDQKRLPLLAKVAAN